MDQPNFKSAFLDFLKQIRKKPCSYQIKIRVIEGLMGQLRLIESNPEFLSLKSLNLFPRTSEMKIFNPIKKFCPSQNQSTSYSFYSDNSEILDSTIQDYEQKIMEKRVIKFGINEEIQALEDDLFEIEKVVETKRNYNDKLAKTIQKSMTQVEENPKTTTDETFAFFHKQKKDRNSLNATINWPPANLTNKNKESLSHSFNIGENKISLGQLNLDPKNVPRKKAKSNLSKSITGIFKSLIK